ncbi:MAG: carboxypeptidase-like regulatory domain-containing protein [Chitinophagales bacterium]|nr:carboxypeptidase-like regulatory domain-containing protein [Chitinophagales bacterium]MBP9796605.1 carboxypeptidase-like regulatory domain-containing protein [Chitinophagales bacterium]
MRKIFTILTILLLSTPFSLLAQNRTISGVVKDSETGLSIPGATVMVKENNGIGASTDLEGKFTLSIPPPLCKPYYQIGRIHGNGSIHRHFHIPHHKFVTGRF